jgi:rubrerythrin
MRKMTEENLKAAFAGESQAHLKSLNYAEKAKREGKENVARLFAAASYAEQVHASAHLRTLGGVGNTAENLHDAICGEGFESDEMYPAYIVVAEAQGEKRANTVFSAALEAEKVHRALYQRAKESVDAGQDAEFGPIWVCSVCGFTGEGDAPDKCPVCNAPKERFTIF